MRRPPKPAVCRLVRGDLAAGGELVRVTPAYDLPFLAVFAARLPGVRGCPASGRNEFEYGARRTAMATTPRTKNPNDAALSAVEEALRLDYTPEEETEQVEATGTRPPRERRPALPAVEPQVRRPDTQQRRVEAPRMPAPPRRTARIEGRSPGLNRAPNLQCERGATSTGIFGPIPRVT